MPKRKYWERIHSVEKVQKLSEIIRPTIRNNGDLYYIKREAQCMWNKSFIWDPVPMEKATSLKQLADITTYHKFDNYWSFLPTIGEVIGRIPQKYLKKVVAFEIIDKPRTIYDINDMRGNEAFKQNYHEAKVRLYAKNP